MCIQSGVRIYSLQLLLLPQIHQLESQHAGPDQIRLISPSAELSGRHSPFSVHTLFPQVFAGRSFTGFFCNENAKFTQSLCSLFTTITGECSHSHVHSLFAANRSSECSSTHVSVGDYQHRVENKQTNRSEKGVRVMIRCKGFMPITNHANEHN